MGAPAAIFAGQLITSIVVSKVATTVAQKLGFSDSMSSTLGMVAGVAAGGYVGGQASAAKTASDAASGGGTSVFAGMDGPEPSELLASGGSVAPATPPPMHPGMDGPIDTSIAKSAQQAPTVDKVASTSTGAGQNTAQSVIDDEGEDFWSKLLSSDKTSDLVMAGMQGAGQAGMKEFELKYPEKVAEENAQGWLSAFGGNGLANINQSFPSQR